MSSQFTESGRLILFCSIKGAKNRPLHVSKLSLQLSYFGFWWPNFMRIDINRMKAELIIGCFRGWLEYALQVTCFSCSCVDLSGNLKLLKGRWQCRIKARSLWRSLNIIASQYRKKINAYYGANLIWLSAAGKLLLTSKQ